MVRSDRHPQRLPDSRMSTDSVPKLNSPTELPAGSVAGAGTEAVPLFDVLVVITAWNIPEFVRNCLQALFAAPLRAKMKVVVLDDGGSDGLDTIVGTFPEVDFLRSETNLGFIRANNLVLRRYWNAARYFLLLNADTTVEAGAIDSTVDFLDQHPEAGIAGCKVVKPDGTLDWPCRRS